eukprot:361781-Chlamydomonas_euryale.AAC.3
MPRLPLVHTSITCTAVHSVYRRQRALSDAAGASPGSETHRASRRHGLPLCGASSSAFASGTGGNKPSFFFAGVAAIAEAAAPPSSLLTAAFSTPLPRPCKGASDPASAGLGDAASAGAVCAALADGDAVAAPGGAVPCQAFAPAASLRAAVGSEPGVLMMARRRCSGAGAAAGALGEDDTDAVLAETRGGASAMAAAAAWAPTQASWDKSASFLSKACTAPPAAAEADERRCRLCHARRSVSTAGFPAAPLRGVAGATAFATPADAAFAAAVAAGGAAAVATRSRCAPRLAARTRPTARPPAVRLRVDRSCMPGV